MTDPEPSRGYIEFAAELLGATEIPISADSRRVIAELLHALLARAEAAEASDAESVAMYHRARDRADAAHAAGFRAGAEAMREAAARLCDQWAGMDADIGALKATVAQILGPDWPDNGLPVATAREWAATRQHAAEALAHAIRALPLPQPQEPPR